MTEHTPGPWIAKPTGLGKGEEYQIEASGDEIALIYACDGLDEPTWFPGKANALLIAAAPDMEAEIDHLRAVNADMLAALKGIAEWWLNEEMKNHTGAPYAIFAARAAIAAAESPSVQRGDK